MSCLWPHIIFRTWYYYFSGHCIQYFVQCNRLFVSVNINFPEIMQPSAGRKCTQRTRPSTKNSNLTRWRTLYPEWPNANDVIIISSLIIYQNWNFSSFFQSFPYKMKCNLISSFLIWFSLGYYRFYFSLGLWCFL